MAHVINKDNGELIKRQRLVLGYTQEDVARAIGVSLSTFQSYESGRVPSRKNEKKLVEFLFGGHDPNAIPGEEGSPEVHDRMPKRAKGAPRVDIDAKLLAKIINYIYTFMESKNITLSVEKKSSLIALAYAHCHSRGEFDKSTIDNLFSLAT